MKLRPLTAGAPGKSAWPAIDPYPANHGLVLDFIGSKTCGRPFYKLLNDRYADATQIPGWNYSGSTSNGQPRYAETRAGRLIPFAAGVPRITDRGLLIEEVRANKVAVFNANPTSLSGVTKSGDAAATLTLVNDMAALVAAGLAGVVTGGQVFKLDNSAGSIEAQAFMNGSTGNTNTHTASAYVKAMLGSGSVTGGISAEGATAFSHSSLARVSVTFTPAAPRQMGVRASPGSIVYFILPQLEEGAVATSPIVTTGAPATRAADNLYISGLAAILGRFRANLVAYSTPTAGQWSTTNAGVGSIPTVTYGAGIGPNGTPSARVQFALNGGIANGDQSNFYSSPAPYTTGVTATASIWLKSNTAATYQVAIATPNGQQILVSVTPAWQRFSVTHTPAASGGGGVTVRLRGSTGSSDSADILVADAQWEAGADVTEFIATSGSPASVGSPFTLVAWADLPASDGRGVPLVTANPAGLSVSRLALYRRDPGTPAAVHVLASSPTNLNVSTNKAGARILKMAARQRGTQLTAGADTEALASLGRAGPTALDRLNIGSEYNGTLQPNGYVQMIAILADTTDAQLLALTA